GGSSSGSGAAVADFHVPLTLGTQTGGSVIRPASYCGTFALKPTWGLVGRDGVKTYSATLDTVGWFARSANDLALLYDVFDPDPTPLPAFDITAARIAICRTPAWHKADAATVQVFEQATDLLKQAGARLTELALPEEFNELPDCHARIMRMEGRISFLAEYRQHGNDLHPFLREQAENIDGYTRADLTNAYDVAARCR